MVGTLGGDLVQVSCRRVGEIPLLRVSVQIALLCELLCME